MTPEASVLVEKYAIRCALGNNGGTWETHYTEEQKEFWRKFVRDLLNDHEQFLVNASINALAPKPSEIAPDQLISLDDVKISLRERT